MIPDGVEKVVFWGATGQARVLRECIQHLGIPLVALFDNNATVTSPFADVALHVGERGLEEWLRSEPDPSRVGFLVAIGGDRGFDRVEIQSKLEAVGLRALTASHPRSFVASSAQLGAGTQVLAQAAVCVDAQLGRSVIVNTGASVDHECIIGDGVHLCPGTHLAGNVIIGRFATIGTGAVVLPRVVIGERAVIGAGAVVLRDVEPMQVVAGNPAREIRRRKE